MKFNKLARQKAIEIWQMRLDMTDFTGWVILNDLSEGQRKLVEAEGDKVRSAMEKVLRTLAKEDLAAEPEAAPRAAKEVRTLTKAEIGDATGDSPESTPQKPASRGITRAFEMTACVRLAPEVCAANEVAIRCNRCSQVLSVPKEGNSLVYMVKLKTLGVKHDKECLEKNQESV